MCVVINIYSCVMNPRFHEHVVSNSVGPNTLPCGTPSDRCSRSGGNPPLLLLSVDHHSGLRSAGLRGPQTEETPRSSGVVWSEGPTWRRHTQTPAVSVVPRGRRRRRLDGERPPSLEVFTQEPALQDPRRC